MRKVENEYRDKERQIERAFNRLGESIARDFMGAQRQAQEVIGA